MHIEVLVEESSAEAALQNLLPKILSNVATFNIHPHQGKPDLLRKLPALLRGYRNWLPEDWHIVILVDADDDDCLELKAQLEQIAQDAGLVTKSVSSAGQQFQVLNRLAMRELEAWFFGDIEALNAAYPRISLTLGQRAKYRNPDAITGGTWEALERLLQRLNYFPEGLPKITVAREVSRHMDPIRNRSRSFQIFRQGLMDLIHSSSID
jgi:hypothetical protein